MLYSLGRVIAVAIGPMAAALRLVTLNSVAEVAPATIPPKSLINGEIVNGCEPPASRARAVPPAAAFVASHAVRRPARVGAKDTATVQLAPPARVVAAQPSETMRKCAASGPERPSTMLLVGVVPMFVIVNVRVVALGSPKT